jgi:hypothetical protein
MRTLVGILYQYFEVLRSSLQRYKPTVLQPSLVRIWQNKKRSGFVSRYLDEEECEELLHQYINMYPQNTIVLDALDECNL